MNKYSIWVRFEKIEGKDLDSAFKELQKYLELVSGIEFKILKSFTKDFYPVLEKFRSNK